MTDVPNLFRIILQVSDLSKAADFYAQLLGAAGRGIRGGRHYFDCGPVIRLPMDGEELCKHYGKTCATAREC
jgi:hypothetical protein